MSESHISGFIRNSAGTNQCFEVAATEKYNLLSIETGSWGLSLYNNMKKLADGCASFYHVLDCQLVTSHSSFSLLVSYEGKIEIYPKQLEKHGLEDI